MTPDKAGEILSTYLEPVYGFALKRCKSREDAEDLSQEIMLRAYRALTTRGDIGDPTRFRMDYRAQSALQLLPRQREIFGRTATRRGIRAGGRRNRIRRRDPVSTAVRDIVSVAAEARDRHRLLFRAAESKRDIARARDSGRHSQVASVRRPQ